MSEQATGPKHAVLKSIIATYMRVPEPSDESATQAFYAWLDELRGYPFGLDWRPRKRKPGVRITDSANRKRKADPGDYVVIQPTARPGGNPGIAVVYSYIEFIEAYRVLALES